jgi:hypothetical protein
MIDRLMLNHGRPVGRLNGSRGCIAATPDVSRR